MICLLYTSTESLQAGMKNVAFLRTNIEIIERFFAEGEVSEIWPVSYTHLDVYKRQVFYETAL